MNSATALETLVKQSPTAKTVIDMLAERQRFRRESNVDFLWSRLMKENNGRVNREDYLNTFKALQDQGYGAVVNGRGGKSTRFVWSMNLKDVANSVLTGTPISDEAKLPPMPKARKKTRRSKPKVKVMNHFEPSVQVIINLPANIGPERIKQIVDQLKNTAY